VKTKYAVLNDKLLPVKVADLLLKEALGTNSNLVSILFRVNEQNKESYLDTLLLKAVEAGISHSYTVKFIFEMLIKMINNNSQKSGEIIVEIVQGNKIFLHIYFLE